MRCNKRATQAGHPRTDHARDPQGTRFTMKKPSTFLYKETLSEFQQVPVKNLTGRRRASFAMLPKDVLRRRDINPCSKLTLAAMNMESKCSGFVFASDEAIADLAGISRASVIAARTLLEHKELIEKNGDPIGQVQGYKLLHADMAPSESAKASGQADIPKGGPQCSKCKKSIKNQTKTGLCRKCARQKHDAEVYEAARAHLRSDDHAEIVATIEQERALKKWHPARVATRGSAKQN